MAKKAKATQKATKKASTKASKAGAAPRRPTKKAAKASPGKKARAKSVRQDTAVETPANSQALAKLRGQIDRLDAKLVKILNDRAELVREVGKLKRGQNIPIYAPHREAEVLEKVLKANHGPLPDRTIEGVYRELMSGSFALEQPLRIGFLGPAGSHSHVAATKHFGASVEYENLHEIAGVFTEVRRGHVNYGLIPIENSTGGGIAESLDAFREHAGRVSIYSEVQIAIHHALLANCAPKSVKRVYSKPEVFSQCRNWLATQLPGRDLVAAASSSRAAQIAAEENEKAISIGHEPTAAAIGTALAGEMYGLKTIFPRIEDNPNNITRFLVISKEQARRTGDDKTSIMFVTEDRPGALVEVLSVFHASGVNLSHLDKRPSGRQNWQYTFFVDASGHRDDPIMKAAIHRVGAHCKEMAVLGSYPRSKRIL